jgi:plasmid stability protein
MAKNRVVVEDFPLELLRELKVRAAQEGTSVKALLIAAAEALMARKAMHSLVAGKSKAR